MGFLKELLRKIVEKCRRPTYKHYTSMEIPSTDGDILVAGPEYDLIPDDQPAPIPIYPDNVLVAGPRYSNIPHNKNIAPILIYPNGLLAFPEFVNTQRVKAKPTGSRAPHPDIPVRKEHVVSKPPKEIAVGERQPLGNISHNIRRPAHHHPPSQNKSKDSPSFPRESGKTFYTNPPNRPLPSATLARKQETPSFPRVSAIPRGIHVY